MQELRQSDIWISSPSSKKPKLPLTLQSGAISENVWVRHWEQIGGDRVLETQHFKQQRGVDGISQQKIQTSRHFSLTLYTGSCSHPWQSHSYTRSVLSLLDTWGQPASERKRKSPSRPRPPSSYPHHPLPMGRKLEINFSTDHSFVPPGGEMVSLSRGT